MHLLSAQKINKSFLFKGKSTKVLTDVFLDIAVNEFVSIIGSSGCGKSTLLELLCGITNPDSGDVYFEGSKVTGKTGILGYMPQDDLLFPWLTTLDNILLPAKISKADKHKSKERALELLPIFGLSEFLHYLPWQLSGGLRQRVALARTYMTGSKVLLLDEPLANLDAITRGNLQDWLKEIVAKLQLTIVMVTHDIEEAVKLSNRIMLMKNGSFLDSIRVSPTLTTAERDSLRRYIQERI